MKNFSIISRFFIQTWQSALLLPGCDIFYERIVIFSISILLLSKNVYIKYKTWMTFLPNHIYIFYLDVNCHKDGKLHTQLHELSI